MLNRPDAEAPIHENHDDTARSGDQSDAEKRRLVAGLDLEPALREVVDCWRLLDEPIRDAILHLIRAKSR